jgi:hypothetical protein
VRVWLPLTLLAPAVLVACVALYGLDFPYLDQWELVPLLEKMHDGSLRFADFWALHTDHRLVVPRAIMLLLARLSSWDTRWEMACSVVLAGGLFATLAHLLRPRLWPALALLSWLVFSMTHEENWLWGWQLQVFAHVLCVVGSAALLCRRELSIGAWLGALALAAASLLCFASGAVWLVVGALVIAGVHRSARWALAGWLIVSATVLALYLKGWGGGELAAGHSHRTFVYLLAWLGSPIAGFALLPAVVAGVLALAALVVLVRELQRQGELLRDLAPALALATYAIGSGFLAAVGRAGTMDPTQALTSRYRIVSSLLYVALSFLLVKLRAPGLRWKLPALGVAALVVVSSGIGVLRVRAGCAIRREYVRALIDGDRTLYPEIHPLPELIDARLPVLKRLRLSLFR